MSKYIVARANTLVFVVIVVVLSLLGVGAWDRFSAVRSARLTVERTNSAVITIKDLGIATRDAETGQRGYLLTGDESYLAPYHSALGRVHALLAAVRSLTATSDVQQGRIQALTPLIDGKLDELALTVRLRREQGLDAALKVVRAGAGHVEMTRIEQVLSAMTTDEEGILSRELAASASRGAWIRALVLSGGLLAILGLLLASRMLNQALLRAGRLEAEQRKLAVRLRASLDSLSQGVAVFDTDRCLTNWNDCFRLLLAVPQPLLRQGTSYGRITEAGGLLETDADILRARHAGEVSTTYERSVPDGAELEIHRTATPEGGFVVTVSDMTRRVQAEAVMREAQKMQAIGQLTGGIAHDFNNLLTVVLGNLEFARSKTNDDPVLQARIDRAAWAARRGATLTAQMLAFARKQPLAPSPIDLAVLLPELLPLLQRTLGEHVDTRFVAAPELWPAMADAAQLESAVLNLAINARDAMPRGGRLTIEIANKVIDQAYARAHAEVTVGDYVMVAVSDTGTGMASDIVARVFEPFFTTKPDGKGTGLGLAMVFGFVKQSGGHVKIYSELGEGTTVRLYLPRALRDPAYDKGPTVPLLEPRGTGTILVVEDDEAVREVAVTMLAELGYRVIQAEDGEEALRVFGENAASVDLLLSDVVLPGALRGRDIADRITAIRPEIKVLFMSGYTENSIIHGGRLDAGVHLISKPFPRDQLARKVAELLRRPVPAARIETGKVVPLRARRD